MKTLRNLIALILLIGFHSAQAHNALLPRPQEIHYDNGQLPVSGLVVQIAGKPNAEDKFAGECLEQGLEAKVFNSLPMPKHKWFGPAIVLKRTGDAPALPGIDDKASRDSRESYSIKISKAGVEIIAPGSAGLFYGVQTLLQMIEVDRGNATLPFAEIHDWPTLAYRGAMIDFSEGELIRLSEAKRQIDLLARFKANQYYFYSEASIEFEGMDVVLPNGRWSRADVRELVDYARQRHIDVVPCMELFGHMHNLFRYEKFADLGLPRYGEEFDPRNPKMYEFLDNWVNQTADLFPSPWYHVGFDEPWSLGKIGVVPGQDPFKTFTGVLAHISEKAKSRGKRTLFWADINEGASTLSNHPELLSEVPAGDIACPWVYEAHTNYAPWVEPLAKRNIPTMVAPGVWGWNELFPDYRRSFFNINELTAAGRKENTLGVINTTWTDSRQTIYRLTYPGLAFGAAAAWQHGAVDTNSFFSDYCEAIYPANVAAEVAPALEDLSTAEEIFEDVLQETTQSSFWADPLAPGHLKKLQAGTADLRRARLLAENAQEHLQRALRISSDPTLKSFLLSARLFDYLGMKSLYAVEWAGYFDELKQNPTKQLVQLYIGNQMNSTTYGMLTDLREMISELREQYRDAWLEEATPFRLESALYRWDNEWNYWTDVQHLLVQQVLHGWKEGEPFPSIEVIRPKAK